MVLEKRNLMMKNVLLACVAAITVFAGLAGAFDAPPRVTAAVAQEIVVGAPKGAPVSFADLIEKVSPAVVSIQARGKGGEGEEAQLPPGFEDFPGLEEFFRRRGGQAPQRPSVSVGSGFFISADGVLVTNHHVVDGADEITVRTSDEREFTAEVVGTDQPTDLAVLRIKGTKAFPYVTFDRDADLRVGDWVVAVGNPFGLEGSATAGIVSAKGRQAGGAQNSYVQFHQIDAPINRGNSGGPTFDLRGRVIGVNSQILSPTGGNVGIGFAIPSETAADIVDQLLRNGKVTRGWLGVTIQGLDDELRRSYGLNDKQGALITAVAPGGPAASAGLRSGDLVLKVNGQSIEDQADLTRKIGAAAVGSTAKLEVLREGERRTFSVKLAERTDAVLQAQQGGAAPDQPGQPPTGVQQKELGISVRPFNAEERRERGEGGAGLIVTAVEANSVLDRKGIQDGDALLRASGRPLATAADLDTAVADAIRAGRPLRLEVERDGQTLFVAADLAGQN